MFVAPASRALVNPPTTMPPKRRAKRMEDGLMSEGWSKRKERTQRVLVMSGMVKRFASASRRNALRITEPDAEGEGIMGGLAAGDFMVDILGGYC